MPASSTKDDTFPSPHVHGRLDSMTDELMAANSTSRGFGLQPSDAYCLFGTVHVKTATAILTIIYLIEICFWDYSWNHLEMSPTSFIIGFVICLLALASTLCAQCGLSMNLALYLLPFRILQFGILFVIVGVYEQFVMEAYLRHGFLDYGNTFSYTRTL
ncbi:hypothetical protein AB6A40_009842 [Gnathostoma spinigerum]|uniref:Uncharacterized protein n=1 Tax=Gnathostoma spinigerum TaxID=75299 RepID=A0ABD6ETI6_9BILA